MTDLDGATDTSDEELDDTRPAKHTNVRKFIAEGYDSYGESQSTTDDENGPRLAKNSDCDRDKAGLWASDEDSNAAYKKWKDRKFLKRKRTPANSRKEKAEAKKATTGKKQVRVNASKPQRKERNWGDASEDDNQLMEHTLPDYLQKRRTNFDKRYEKLNAAGLKLPPTYEEVNFSDDERLEELNERPCFPKGEPKAPYADKQLPKSLGVIPASIAQWLRDYQVEGTAFLHQLFVYQTGGVLGDDMGLGKTVQVIAFLTAAFGKTGDERDAKRMRKMRRAMQWYPKVLVVCPGTLIENWKNELARWGWWHVDAYHGSGKDEVLEAASSGRLEIMITTYTTYRINKSSINMIGWDCVVADECHQVKGRSSEITQAMNEVNALCRIGLTGTAIQNSYDELWTLLNWTNPGKFGPISTWKQSVSVPLKAGQSHNATVAQLAKARSVAKKLVNNVLPQVFLRRMKTLIADQLPKKSDRVVFCPLTVTQTGAYERIIESDIVRYIKEATADCHCGSGKKAGWCCQQRLEDGSHWRNHVFPSITHLMKICNHLAVLIPQQTDSNDRQVKNLDVLQVALPEQWRKLYKTRDNINNYVNPEFCGKWKILHRLLQFWHNNGDKVLVFSHSVRLLKMLQKLFSTTSYNVAYLDGAMKYEDRAQTVDDFNSDPDQFVFLISTKAGGVGLNITSANKVVVFDPSWNPAHDLQAQDRAYRIGQTRNVEVFRLICTGTIEEIVYARQIYKQQQANIGYTASHERRYFKGVQENKDQKGEIFGLVNMFTFQEGRVVLRDIVNKTNVAESKAGVNIADIDLGDTQTSPEDPLSAETTSKAGEDAFMSQLASQLIEEAESLASASQDTTTTTSKKKKSKIASTGDGNADKKLKRPDPVSAILAGAGVEYTHFNSEVVGSSKVEASLSRRAQENGISMGDEQVFARNTQECQPVTGSPAGQANGDNEDSYDDEAVAVHQIPWRYHPPEGVRKRQLCAMAELYGFKDAVEFSLVVEGWTQEQRRNCLDRYYASRRRVLGIGVKKLEVDGVTGAREDETAIADGSRDKAETDVRGNGVTRSQNDVLELNEETGSDREVWEL